MALRMVGYFGLFLSEESGVAMALIVPNARFPCPKIILEIDTVLNLIKADLKLKVT